ncbi:hypothetical protein [Sphingomonas oryzagri]
MRDKMLAQPDPASAVVIIYDRVNTEEQPDRYVLTLQDAIQTIRSNKYLIMPQVPNSSDKTDPFLITKMIVINEAILARWPRHTFGQATRDRFIKALSNPHTRADGIHRNAAGERIEAAYIKQWLNGKHWL